MCRRRPPRRPGRPPPMITPAPLCVGAGALCADPAPSRNLTPDSKGASRRPSCRPLSAGSAPPQRRCLFSSIVAYFQTSGRAEGAKEPGRARFTIRGASVNVRPAWDCRDAGRWSDARLEDDNGKNAARNRLLSRRPWSASHPILINGYARIAC